MTIKMYIEAIQASSAIIIGNAQYAISILCVPVAFCTINDE
jgi:hypothetical protein